MDSNGLSKIESGRCLRSRKKCKADDDICGSSRNKDSKPEPSKSKSGSRRKPRKKCKTEDDDDHGVCCTTENENYVVSQGSSANINDLPNEMLINIFSYLSVPEKLKAEKVCDKWNLLLRSVVFWKYVNLTDIPNSFFIEILASLPECVSLLRLEGYCESLPISLPELLAKLCDQCPSLESFYLGNIDLVKNLHTVPLRRTRTTDLFNSFLIEDAKRSLDEHSNEIIESEFRKEEDIGLMESVLPQLQILSLRRVLFSQHHIHSHISDSVFPKLVVLDLSFSQPLSLIDIYMFSSLSDLEELYLVGWKISDTSIVNFIKNSSKLRVLDLEHSKVMKKTVSALQQYCNRLEELYLAFCPTEDISRTVENEDFFPCLKILCLKHTKVTPKGVERLITECPSLKLVDVSYSENIDDIWYLKLSKDLKDKIRFNSDERMIYYCDHFSKTKHYNF